MGGVCAEVLVRMGIGGLILVDHDIFEKTNVNRQIHCNQDSFGKPKAAVLAEAFLKINPKLTLRTYLEPVSLKNVKKILRGAHLVVNGMDQMIPSVCLEREARRQGKPIVDAWITPFASVFTMKPTDPHWEEFLDFPTRGVPEKELTPKIARDALRKEVNYTFSHFKPYRHIKKKLVDQIVADEVKRPSLAPVVWLSGVLMANEVFKIAVGLPPVGPRGIFFDQYDHQLIRGNKISKTKR
jgi:molybdopterin/thiamine biosynthesis adenylyltransferase